MTMVARKSSLARRRTYLGFTLVELLITITILACISIIAYIAAQGYVKRSYNSERVANIEYLRTSLSEYAQTKNTLPDIRSNATYYDVRWTYAHSSSGAYGISGHVSSDFLGITYANLRLIDPETKQFYGYGKRVDNSAFDLATVMYADGEYRAYLRGTYDGKDLVSLIRAYSSSDFVSDGSLDTLPYNPRERKITAAIESWSGGVLVNDSTYLTGELNTGDRITVATGGLATVHVSDGSELSLGSASGASVLDLSSLAYSDDNNLASRVALFLHSWEVWTQAPHLRTSTGTSSDLSIQSETAIAAVRGTIMGMSTYVTSGGSHTDIMLAAGKIETMKKSSSSFVNPAVADSSAVSSFSGLPAYSGTAASSIFTVESGHTYMQNAEDQPPVILGIDVTRDNTVGSSQTGTIDPTILKKRLNSKPFAKGFKPTIFSVTSTGFTDGAPTRPIVITFANPQADGYIFSFRPDSTTAAMTSPSYASFFSGTIDPSTNTGAAVTSVINSPGTISLSVCRSQGDTKSLCSAEQTIHIPAGSFDMEGLNNGWDSLGRLGKKGKWPVADPCPAGLSPFASLGCRDNTLIAYAPYDSDGDLTMYTRNPGAIIPISSGGLVRSGYQQFNTTQFTAAWKDNLRDAGYLTPYIIQKLSNPGAFYNWNGSATGVLIPNSSDASSVLASLRYDLSPLALGDTYSLEFSVRGGALTRIGNTYVIASSLPSSSSLPDYANFVLKLYNGYLVLSNSGLNTVIPLSGLPIQTPDFYHVRYDRTGPTGRLSILLSNGNTLTSTGVATSNTIDAPFFNRTSDLLHQYLYIGGNSTDVNQWNDIIDSVKIFVPPPPNCPPWQTPFGWLGCQDSSLIGFAPYDTNGDLKMYVRDSTGSIAPQKTGMMGSGYLLFQVGTSLSQFTTSNAWWPNTGGASTPPNAMKLGNPSPFYSWTNTGTATTTTGILVPTSTGGDTSGQSASLRYDITGMNLGDDFRIEFSVRGWALRRSSGNYGIANSEPPAPSTSPNFRLWLDASNRRISFCNGASNCAYINLASLSLEDARFYRLQYNKTWGIGKLVLLDNETFLWEASFSSYAPFINNNTSGIANLYVGSGYQWIQWNDIIDSVKVYRLP